MADDNPFSDPSLQAADSSARQEELPSWATAPADGAPPTRALKLLLIAFVRQQP